MQWQNNGLVAMGLGASATSLILGKFSLGVRKIEVILTPAPQPPRGYSGRVGPRHQPIAYDVITFTITHNNQVTVREYRTPSRFRPFVIRITNIINTITTNISVTVSKIRKLTNIFRIKR